MASTNSSGVVSTLPPMSPTWAQNFDKCLVPESHSIVTTECPGPRRSAALVAAVPASPVSVMTISR